MPFGAGGYFYKQGRVEMKGVLLSSSALLFLAASGAGAWADDQGVETIVVTAEKRTECRAERRRRADRFVGRRSGEARHRKRQRTAIRDAEPEYRAGIRQRPAGIPPARRRLRRLRLEQFFDRRRVHRRSRLSRPGARRKGCSSISSARKSSTDRKARSTASTRRAAPSISSPTSRPIRSPPG